MEVPICINGNKATSICISDHCSHPNPFICDSCVNNQCAQLHEDCITSQWKKIKSMMEKSKKPNNPEFTKISNAVEQTINKAMKYLQKQLEYFKMWKLTFGMPAEAVNLFKCIQEKQEHKFTGKQMAQILKDLKTEKDIQKFNQVKMKNSINEVLVKMEKTQNMIREMYSVCQVPQLTLKIKQRYLSNVNNRLNNLEEKPTELEIKYENQEEIQLTPQQRRYISFSQQQRSISPFYQPQPHYVINHFAQSLKNPNLKSLKTLTLYYPFVLGYNSSFINAQKQISSSLLSLPYLSLVTIIANDIKSLNGFKSLGTKLNVSKDEGWSKGQKW